MSRKTISDQFHRKSDKSHDNVCGIFSNRDIPSTSGRKQKAIAMGSIVHETVLNSFNLQMHRELGKGVSRVDFFSHVVFFDKETVAVLGSIMACLC